MKDGFVGFLWSILLHVILIGSIFFQLDLFDSKPSIDVGSKVPAEPIQAVAVDEQLVQDEIRKLEVSELRKKNDEEKRLKRLEEAEKKLKQVEKQKQQLELQKKQEQQKAAIALNKRKSEEQAAQKAKAERAVVEQRLAEARKKAEEAAQREKEELARKEKAQKLAAQKAKQLAREKALREQLAAEEQALQRRRDESELEKYNRLIKDKVTRNWSRPLGWDAGTVCSVMVSLIPGGQVIGVEFKKKCSNEVFDRSMETAVFKASPLPVPSDSRLFNLNYRKFTFEFKVED